jgi:multidrug transporter EmrE-like cation transporter
VGIAAVLTALRGWLVFNEPALLRRLMGSGLAVSGIVPLEM